MKLKTFAHMFREFLSNIPQKFPKKTNGSPSSRAPRMVTFFLTRETYASAACSRYQRCFSTKAPAGGIFPVP